MLLACTQCILSRLNSGASIVCTRWCVLLTCAKHALFRLGHFRSIMQGPQEDHGPVKMAVKECAREIQAQG